MSFPYFFKFAVAFVSFLLFSFPPPGEKEEEEEEEEEGGTGVVRVVETVWVPPSATTSREYLRTKNDLKF